MSPQYEQVETRVEAGIPPPWAKTNINLLSLMPLWISPACLGGKGGLPCTHHTYQLSLCCDLPLHLGVRGGGDCRSRVSAHERERDTEKRNDYMPPNDFTCLSVLVDNETFSNGNVLLSAVNKEKSSLQVNSGFPHLTKNPTKTN